MKIDNATIGGIRDDGRERRIEVAVDVSLPGVESLLQQVLALIDADNLRRARAEGPSFGPIM